MQAVNGRAFRLGACRTCGGEACLETWDEPEGRCLQCGRAVPDDIPAFAANGQSEAERAA